MSPGDREALTVLSCRMGHVAATAELLSNALTGRPENDVLAGIAETLIELGERLDRIAEPATA